MIKQACLIIGLVITAGVAAGPAWPGEYPDAEQSAALDARSQVLLDMHNSTRKSFGSDDLAWSDDLAKDAERWAKDLAKRNVMQHASAGERKGAGENLWLGTKGRYTPEQMIAAFVAEKQYFKPGEFPNVTTTGNWADVGHYTQLVWPETTEVGCAIASNENDDFLVCRYLPAGNIRGVPLG